MSIDSPLGLQVTPHGHHTVLSKMKQNPWLITNGLEINLLTAEVNAVVN